MIYADLEHIIEDHGIENKYALAMIVATRARTLSERKDNISDTSTSELCITKSLSEIEQSKLDIASLYVPADA